MGYDFSGYATKNDLTCGDGRIIRKDAFKDCDGKTVPLVWHHIHNDPMNVLGHADLENRDDGVYAYCSFNDTPQGQNAKTLVQHGDVTSMSIYANKLKQQGNNVLHGMIREVSLVLAGANPGALIDPLSIQHSDGDITELDDEAIIYSGEIFHSEDMAHADDSDEEEEDVSKSEKTVQDVIDSMTEEQKNVMYYMVGQALQSEGDDSDDDDAEHSDMEDDMHRNVFDQTDDGTETLSHDAMNEILAEAPRSHNGSLKDTFLEHGIENLEILFPEARAIDNTPTFIKRETGWVSAWWGALKKTPFSRIKSRTANITEYEARARGYIKGNQKIEEFFSLASRTTTPTTVYKLQKLDRDDIVDIVDMDVVAWMKSEMRMMLEEELAVATLIGDGRPANDVSKINEANIRPIYHDDDLYCIHKVVTIPQSATYVQIADALIDAALLSRKDYKGTGQPWFVTTNDVLTRMLLAKDEIGHRLYKTESELATALRVSRILEVPVLEGAQRTAQVPGETEGSTVNETRTLLGLIVNPADYVVGADKGGAVTMFDDFDLNFNKYEYLIETRCSGALQDPFTAIALETTSTLPFTFGPRSGDYSTATKTKDAKGWPEGYPEYTAPTVDDGE
jgi:HK97 family phage prohead protease